MAAYFRRFLIVILLALSTMAAPVFAKTTIQVYHRNETREIVWMQQVKEAFEALNPDIEVELIQGIDGGGAGYAERLAVLWASGNPPDVFYGSTDKAGYILNQWAMDITDFLQRDQAEMEIHDFFPGVFDASTRDGRHFGVPAIAMGHAIFYNKELLAQAGLAPPSTDWDAPDWTWEDFSLYAEKLTRFGDDGSSIQAGVSGINNADLAWIFGGDWFPEEAYQTGIPEYTTLLQDETIAAYEELRILSVEKGVTANSPRSGVDNWSGFWNGLVGMEWTGWWKMRNYLEVTQDGGMTFDWGIAPMPLVNNRHNTRWSDPWFISSVSNHPQEAWRFVKFVTGVEGQISFAETVAFPPSRQSAFDTFIETVSDMSGMSPGELLTALSGALNHSRTAMDETIGGSSVWSPIIDQEITPALQGDRDVRTSLEIAEQRIEAALPSLIGRWQGTE